MIVFKTLIFVARNRYIEWEIEQTPKCTFVTALQLDLRAASSGCIPQSQIRNLKNIITIQRGERRKVSGVVLDGMFSSKRNRSSLMIKQDNFGHTILIQFSLVAIHSQG